MMIRFYGYFVFLFFFAPSCTSNLVTGFASTSLCSLRRSSLHLQSVTKLTASVTTPPHVKTSSPLPTTYSPEAKGLTYGAPLLEDGSTGITLALPLKPRNHCYVWYNTAYEPPVKPVYVGATPYPRSSSKRTKAFLAVAAILCICFFMQQTLMQGGRTGAIPPLGYLYKTYPIRASILTCGIKSVVADAISQLKSWKPQEQALSFCTRQSLSYVTYGAIFLGMGSGIVYTRLMPVLFPNIGSGLQAIITQACFDNFVCAPLLWLPPAYVIKSLYFPVHEYEIDAMHGREQLFKTLFMSVKFATRNIVQGLQNYLADIKEEGLLKKYWSLWLPAQMITFSPLIPRHLRSTCTAAISFGWLLILMNLADKNE